MTESNKTETKLPLGTEQCDICNDQIVSDQSFEHHLAHFNDANTPMVVIDPSGASRIKAHASYDNFTQYGKCVMILSFINSDLPALIPCAGCRNDHRKVSAIVAGDCSRRRVDHQTDVRKLSQIRDRCIHALNSEPSRRVTEFAAVLADGSSNVIYAVLEGGGGSNFARNEYDRLFADISKRSA